MPRDLPIGNGTLLVTFDRRYVLRDVFFPHVGPQDHTIGGYCRFGVWVDGAFSWIDTDDASRDTRYQAGTLVTNVTCSMPRTAAVTARIRAGGEVSAAGESA